VEVLTRLSTLFDLVNLELDVKTLGGFR